MSSAWLKAVMADPVITATAKVVAYYVATTVTEDGVSVLTNRAFAQACSCSEKWASEAIEQLVSAGYLLGCSLHGMAGVQLSSPQEQTSNKLEQSSDMSEQTSNKSELCAQSEKAKKGFPLSPVPPLASPSYPLSLSPKSVSMEVQESKKKTEKTVDKTSKSSNSTPGWLLQKSHRFVTIWDLMNTVKFATKDGSMRTVCQKVAKPRAVCECLSSDLYKSVNAKKEFTIAAAWTAERKSQHRNKLGMFLRNWFDTAAKNQDKPETAARVGCWTPL